MACPNGFCSSYLTRGRFKMEGGHETLSNQTGTVDRVSPTVTNEVLRGPHWTECYIVWSNYNDQHVKEGGRPCRTAWNERKSWSLWFCERLWGAMGIRWLSINESCERFVAETCEKFWEWRMMTEYHGWVFLNRSDQGFGQDLHMAISRAVTWLEDTDCTSGKLWEGLRLIRLLEMRAVK